MPDSKRDVLFVTVLHPQISKNILNTDVLTDLKETGRYLIVLIVPDSKQAFFESHYAHENIIIEGIEMESFVNGRMEDFMQVLSRLLIDTHYLHYKRRELLDANRSISGWIRHICRELIVFLFADRKFAGSVFRFFDAITSRSDVFSHLFEKYQPTLIFCTDLFEQLGVQLMREAKHRQVQTVGMVRSWDNCLSKGLLRVMPDTAIVNNEVIGEELSRLHSVPRDTITAVGLPQFDAFIRNEKRPREEFFREHGLDPRKRLIMFAPAGSVLSDTDEDIRQILVKARENDEFPAEVQFFIRNHPQHPAAFSSVGNTPDLFIQTPGEKLLKDTYKETELTPTDLDFLRNVLAHTDVLVWVATSLCLDALIYDIPQVVINFDGYASKDYYASVRRYHDEDHMKKMLALNPFKVANTPKELVRHIVTYLNEPSLQREGRAAVRAQQLLFLDGRAGKRISSLLLQKLS